MMTLLDVGETLEHMIPEWEKHLASSASRDYRTEFCLVVDRTPFRVRANKGSIDVAEVSGQNKVSVSSVDLLHMVVGYEHLEDILAKQRRLIAPKARSLLTSLFPKRDPYVWRLDRF